jgi:hypothetical protein
MNFLFSSRSLFQVECHGMSLTYRHFLVLDGHGNHVTLKTIEHAQEFELEMIILPFHTSHVLQPLHVFYFKPFKTTFRKV